MPRIDQFSDLRAVAQPDAASSPFDGDRFLVNQKALSISEQYRVFDERGRSLLFVRREARVGRRLIALLATLITLPVVWLGVTLAASAVLGDRRFAIALVAGLVCGTLAAIVVAGATWPKRHISFCTDEAMQHEAIHVRQDPGWQIPVATYSVLDRDLSLIGVCRKNYLLDLMRRRWECFGPDNDPLCVAMEDSIARAMLRRILGAAVAPLLRTNFVLLEPDGVTKLGEFNRRFTLLDKYTLDLAADPRRKLDRRLAVALGVLLDTGEHR